MLTLFPRLGYREIADASLRSRVFSVRYMPGLLSFIMRAAHANSLHKAEAVKSATLPFPIKGAKVT